LGIIKLKEPTMLKHLLILSVVFVLAACGRNDADLIEPAEIFSPSGSFNPTLNAGQQVPQTGSADTATASVEYDSDGNLIKIMLDVSFVNMLTTATLHIAAIGENNDTDMLELSNVVSPQQISALLNGLMYINIATIEFPGGAIRGQILPSDAVVIGFSLTGSQQVPVVATSANADGYASYNKTTQALTLKVNTTGVEDASMAHIHTGRIGENGPVLVALEQSIDDVNVWSVPEGTTLNAEIFGVLASGGHYVNVHTPANPSGEIRGQIE
jgi:hypothetical protein